jgi:UDP-N-acetylmuramyl tripeptide synthase
MLGKILRFSLRLLRQGGSALPGRIIEKISPRFLTKMMSMMRYGVVLVSGTNGKTTTTHIIANLFEAQGIRVFTNKSGSNFSRGIISELIRQCSIFGNPKADVAVLELDEAYGVHFVKSVQPNVSVFLNVMRDQLDRFGELEYTASLLTKIAYETKDTVILNREDPYVARISENIPRRIKKSWFGLSPKLRPLFPSDDELYANRKSTDSETPAEQISAYKTAQVDEFKDRIIFEDYTAGDATYTVNGHKLVVPEVIKGIYNAYNCAAAISAVQHVLGGSIDGTRLVAALEGVDTAFGRGESIIFKGVEYELILVKNPSGFRLSLLSFEPDDSPVMIAINDDYADGRDVSWLYDVDFGVLKKKKENPGARIITGHRAYDLSLKFAYTDTYTGIVETDVKKAFERFTMSAVASSSAAKKCRIYATYTAMLQIRALLLDKKGSGL